MWLASRYCLAAQNFVCCGQNLHAESLKLPYCTVRNKQNKKFKFMIVCKSWLTGVVDALWVFVWPGGSELSSIDMNVADLCSIVGSASVNRILLLIGSLFLYILLYCDIKEEKNMELWCFCICLCILLYCDIKEEKRTWNSDVTVSFFVVGSALTDTLNVSVFCILAVRNTNSNTKHMYWTWTLI